MSSCIPSCVEIKEGWTSRQKWNYVKNLYQANYAIDSNGDIADPRSISDPARVADFLTWDSQYNEDYNTWSVYYSHVAFEQWLQWKYKIGTTFYGNLPRYKRLEHEGHCWMPCPYSTDSSDGRSETMLGFVPSKVDHGDYYMKTDNNGTAWGW
ncbi:MAG: hypothetical protein PVG39_10190, partial [Desulfobacteraceae bacterium]